VQTRRPLFVSFVQPHRCDSPFRCPAFLSISQSRAPPPSSQALGWLMV
jgi:hypothetical protein